MMEYEDTGMTPEEAKKLHDEQDKHRCIPAAERPPEEEIAGWKKQMIRTFMGERL